jgi:hypothetical protein
MPITPYGRPQRAAGRRVLPSAIEVGRSDVAALAAKVLATRPDVKPPGQ